MPLYHCIAAFIHCNLAPMRLTRITNLAILTATLFNRHTLAISELAAPPRPNFPKATTSAKSASGVSFLTTTLPPGRPARLDTRHLAPSRLQCPHIYYD